MLTTDPAVVATDRLLVAIAAPVPDRARRRLHAGTDAAEAAIGRSGRDAITLPDGRAGAMLRLASRVALAPGDRFVLRRLDPQEAIGGIVLDPRPPRRVSRRRQTPERVAAMAAAVAGGDAAGTATARLDLHGVIRTDGDPGLAPDVVEAAGEAALRAVLLAQSVALGRSTVAAVREAAAAPIRSLATVDRETARRGAAAVIEALIAGGRLVREGDRVRTPDHRPAGPDPAVAAAMERLESILATAAPPPLADAIAAAGCSRDAVRDLERAGRIVVLEPDLGYATATYRDLTATAFALAGRAPLTPAAFRDAIGASRRYVMPILEDLDRRGILRRTPAGHVPGPRAPAGVGGPG